MKKTGTHKWQYHVFAKAPANFADTYIASEIALSKVSVFGRKPHTSLKGMRCKTEWEKGNYKKKKTPRMCLFYPTNLRPPLLFLPLSYRRLIPSLGYAGSFSDNIGFAPHVPIPLLAIEVNG